MLEVMVVVTMEVVLAEEKNRSHVEEVLALEVARYKTRKRESGLGVRGFGVVHVHTSGRHEGREVRGPR